MTKVTNIKSCDMLTLQKMLRSFMNKRDQENTDYKRKIQLL